MMDSTSMMVFSLFLTSLLLLINSQPLYMGSVLVGASLVVAISSSFFYNTSWLSYIFFIILVGGVLVLFLYMAAISPNNPKIDFGLLMLTVPVSAMFSMFSYTELSSQSTPYYSAMNSMYSGVDFYMVPALASYLLMAMIMIVMVTNKNSGALRSV